MATPEQFRQAADEARAAIADAEDAEWEPYRVCPACHENAPLRAVVSDAGVVADIEPTIDELPIDPVRGVMHLLGPAGCPMPNCWRSPRVPDSGPPMSEIEGW